MHHKDLHHHYVIKKMTEYFPQLNKWEITEDDCWKFTESRRVLVRRAPLIVEGYYGRRKARKHWRDYLLLNDALNGFEFLVSFLHEIAHLCLHCPMGERQVLYLKEPNRIITKQDKEADTFTLLGAMPTRRFLEIYDTPFDQLYPFTMDFLIRRKRLYEKIRR